MSVIDKWLNIHRQKEGAATSATSATNQNSAYNPNGLDVAKDLLQAATFTPEAENVAACSNQPATENLVRDQGVKGNVADVADVAVGVNSGSDVAGVADRPIIELGPRLVADRTRCGGGGEVMCAAVSGCAPSDWFDLSEERSAIRQYNGGYSRSEADLLAWGELQNRWHLDHGERLPHHICAGCRRPIGTEQALDLIDGNRVHTGDDNACLTRHGERWRASATRALVALGLRLPRAT